MTELKKLPPPLAQYENQVAEVVIPSMDGWHACTILKPDEVLKNHLWVKDNKGNVHLVPAYLQNFLFSA